MTTPEPTTRHLPEEIRDALALLAKAVHTDLTSLDPAVFSPLPAHPSDAERLICQGAQVLTELIGCASYLSCDLRWVMPGHDDPVSHTMLEQGLRRLTSSPLLIHLFAGCAGHPPEAPPDTESSAGASHPEGADDPGRRCEQ